MEFRLSFIALILATIFPLFVTSVDITVTPPSLSLKKGETLTIKCEETVTETGKNVQVLGLYKEVSGTFQSVVDYSYSIGNAGFSPTWGSAAGNLRSRLNITENFIGPSFRSGTLDFVLSDIQCEDAAAFLCKSQISPGSGTSDSPSKNITINGVTVLTGLTGVIKCDDFNAHKPTCDNCVDSENPNGPIPTYAPINEMLMLTCTANVVSSIQKNAFRWYKKTINDEFQLPITENVSETLSEPTPGSCTYPGTSTLMYYTSSKDIDLRIICDAGSIQEKATKELFICVEGLTYSTGGPGPSGPDPQSASLGGGPIAGIVIGVIAVIVLVVVLVYFLWYRRRDDGESYSTREADGRTAPPPVSKKPEMHENSMYDTTGDNQGNNYYNGKKYNNGPGKVNQSMEPDDYYHHDNDTAPRSRDPIGSSV